MSFYQLGLLWCQSQYSCDDDIPWQVLFHVYSAVSLTSRWPCRISLVPLIMSHFFLFTSWRSSILFCIKGIILKLLTGPWQFQNDVSRLPVGSFVKSLAFGQMSLGQCEWVSERESILAPLHAWHARLQEGGDEVTWTLSHLRDGAFADLSAEISTSEPKNKLSNIGSRGFIYKAINATQWFTINPSWSTEGLTRVCYPSARFLFPSFITSLKYGIRHTGNGMLDKWMWAVCE